MYFKIILSIAAVFALNACDFSISKSDSKKSVEKKSVKPTPQKEVTSEAEIKKILDKATKDFDAEQEKKI